MKNNLCLILNRNNPYGFKVNINHPLVLRKWQDFKKSHNIGKYGMTDELRLEFENIFLNSNYFKQCIAQEKQRYGEAYKYISGYYEVQQ